MKKTFWQFNQQIQQILSEESPMGGPGGMAAGGPPIGGPGGMAAGGPPIGGPGGMAAGGPPMGGPGDMAAGGPPMGGPGDMAAGGPPMGGPPMGGPGDSPKQIELAPLDVWEVLNKILDGKEIKTEKEKKPAQPQANPVQSNNVAPQGEIPPVNI